MNEMLTKLETIGAITLSMSDILASFLARTQFYNPKMRDKTNTGAIDTQEINRSVETSLTPLRLQAGTNKNDWSQLNSIPATRVDYAVSYI